MISDCTAKDITLVWQIRLHVFLVSIERLEKQKHFKPVVSHLGAAFTCTI